MDYLSSDLDTKEKIDYKSTFKLVYSLSKDYKADFSLAFIYLIMATGATLLTPVIAKYTIDLAIKSKNIKYLVFLMAAYLFNSVLFLFLDYLSTMKLIKTGQSLIVKLKNRLYEHVLGLDTDFYSQNPPGRLMARVQGDTSALYELFTQTVVSIFKDIIMFFAIFVIMYTYNPFLTKILFPMVLVIIVIVKIFIDKSSATFVNVRKIVSEISNFLAERLNSISTIQTFNAEKQEAQRLWELNSKKLSMTYKAELYVILFFMTIIMLDPIAKALIFGFGGLKVLNNELSVGILIMFVLYIGQLFEPIFRFSEHIGIIQKSFSAGHRVNKIMAVKPKITDSQNASFIDSLEKDIKFENISMKYADDSPWILKDISFSLEKGKTVAIVGKTGGGKTTITNLLLRFNDFQKGKIEIDGKDIKKLNMKSLRKLIGLVQQDIYLFPATIAENLKLMDKNIQDARLEYAIKTLELEYFYKKHPLNKKITEKGNNLSQGEKQIIALTRSMVLDQQVLCLDEATANIDPYTERMLTKAIKNMMKHKTMLIIAHRLSTIESADTIVFLHNGQIAEMGSHEELIKKEGLYHGYYALQSGF